ncbi:MAG TPA: branched-chain amino acid ABC transporter substrate-binding protein [Ktedonobacterales bacterium]
MSRTHPSRQHVGARFLRAVLWISATLALVTLQGCSLGAHSTSQTLTLLSVFPLTGANGALGQEMQRGVDLAVSQNTALGGGFQLGVTHVNESLGAVGDVVAASISSGGVVGVVGPFSSETALAIEPIIERAGITTITTSATLAGLTLSASAKAEGLDFTTLHPQGAPVAFLRLPQTSDAEGKSAADVMVAGGSRGLSASTVFIVDDGSPSAKAIVTSFGAELRARRASVAGHVTIPNGVLSDPLSMVAAIVAAGPNAVFYAGDTLGAAQVRSALTLSGAPGLPLLAASAAADNPGWSDAVGGPQLAGSTLALLPARDLGKLSTSSSFVSAYEKMYSGEKPLPQAALAYDAAMDEINAIKSAISAGKAPTASAVLAGVTGGVYHGASGDIAFDKNGDNTNPIPFSIYSCDSKGAWTYRGA